MFALASAFQRMIASGEEPAAPLLPKPKGSVLVVGSINVDLYQKMPDSKVRDHGIFGFWFFWVGCG
jgi:hypothetical protein